MEWQLQQICQAFPHWKHFLLFFFLFVVCIISSFRGFVLCLHVACIVGAIMCLFLPAEYMPFPTSCLWSIILAQCKKSFTVSFPSCFLIIWVLANIMYSCFLNDSLLNIRVFAPWLPICDWWARVGAFEAYSWIAIRLCFSYSSCARAVSDGLRSVNVSGNFLIRFPYFVNI